MSRRLEKRLNNCDSKLDALFHGIELNAEIERQLDKIKKYYRKLYMNADDKELSITMYEFFITGLEQIKKGQLTSEEALKELDDINALRKTGVVLENILKTLELLFWASAACVFFSTCVLITPSVIVANPFLAIATLTMASAWAWISVANLSNCIDEFKSSASDDEEYKREKSLISFFKPAALTVNASSNVSTDNEVKQHEEKLYPDLTTI